MNIQNLYFNLPTELIAKKLIRNPDKIRLLILVRSKNKIIHSYFRDILDYLNPGDLLVLNDTKVLPTRMWGVFDKGGQVEVTLVQRIQDNLWEVMVRPTNGFSKNRCISFRKSKIIGNLVGKTTYKGWKLRFESNGEKVEDALKRIAEVNIPFYIRRKVSLHEYQTVFAKKPGSTQCPTAGLHFTKAFLDEIRANGIDIGFITLHIGGSVLPFNMRDYDKFKMYKEYFEVGNRLKEKIEKAKDLGKKIIAVGTTVMRALETVATRDGKVTVQKGWTHLTIKPGYRFKIADGFLTNFHLPGSSHLFLTCAFGGIDNVLDAYQEAIKNKYKFLDFGDTTLII